MDRDPTRVQGIEFGDLEERLESVSYPATGDQLCGALGDQEFGLVDGTMRLEAALDDHREETFDSAAGVLQTVKHMVGADAVGREGYSDRGNAIDRADERSF